MFVEPQSGSKSRLARWVDDAGRRHPLGFDVALVLLAAAVAALLLVQTGYSFVLYQGF